MVGVDASPIEINPFLGKHVSFRGSNLKRIQEFVFHSSRLELVTGPLSLPLLLG